MRSILPFFLTLLISLWAGISASARCVFPNKLLDGESGGANLYAFVNNNPAGGIDVLGYATYFSDPYTLNSSTNYNGVSTFDRGAFSCDFQKLSSEFQSIYSRAGSKFATKYLPNSVEYRNDFSNFGSYWGGVWNRDIAKNTSFNNDRWEPYHSRELTEAFLGNPLSFSGTGYGMLNQAIGGLSSLRGYAESNPYDPHGMKARGWDLALGVVNTPGHLLAEVFNSIALPRITTGEEVVFNGWNRPLSLNTVSTESRYAEAAFTFLPLGVVDDAARLGFKGEAYVARGGAAKSVAGVADDAARSGGRAPDFVVSPGGTAFPVPKGASGPFPVESGKGFQFTGGSGGNGLSSRTTDFRFMDPVTTGKYQYPAGYGSYSNGLQTVNPYTGQTISKSNPLWHIPAE